MTDFEFLGLDGNTHRLPEYDQSLYVDKVSERKDLIPTVPTMAELLRLDPDEADTTLEAPMRMLARLAAQSRVLTLDNHVDTLGEDHPNRDAYMDAKDALIAIINASEWAMFHKVYNEWSAEQKPADPVGED